MHSVRRTGSAARGRTPRRVGVALFSCLFAGQAGLIALSPVLSMVAADFGVSTATAGQLRTVSGLAAGATALVLGRVAARCGLRELLLAGALLLGLGSTVSAIAPSFPALAIAQVAVGIAVAALLTAGTTAAGAWVEHGHRGRVLSFALAGPPCAWIVGMPLVGVVGETSWRASWLVLPLPAALIAAVAASRQPRSRPEIPGGIRVCAALTDRSVRRWSLGELLANAAWVGTLVYAGALLAESYGSSQLLAGTALAAGAVAYVAGNLASRRLLGRPAQAVLARLALALAAGIAIFGAIRPALAVSATLFAAAAFVAGGRTLIGSAFGLDARPDLRLAVMGLRAAANQLGYFLGAAIGGVALAAGGYSGLGTALGALAAAAAAPLLAPARWSLASRARARAMRAASFVRRPSPEF